MAKSISKAAILVGTFAFYSISIFAQNKVDYSSFNKSIVVKSLPFGSFNPTTGLQLGAEYYVTPYQAIDFQYRLLMINWDASKKGDQTSSMYPFLTNIGYRFISKGVDRYYIMPQLQYKQYTRFYRDVLGNNCDEFGCDYFRVFNWQKRQQIASAYLIAGLSGEILDSKLMWDFYCGIGLRKVFSKEINKPDPNVWEEPNQFREWGLDFQDDNPIDIKAGFSIGYLIVRSKK